MLSFLSTDVYVYSNRDGSLLFPALLSSLLHACRELHRPTNTNRPFTKVSCTHLPFPSLPFSSPPFSPAGARGRGDSHSARHNELAMDSACTTCLVCIDYYAVLVVELRGGVRRGRGLAWRHTFVSRQRLLEARLSACSRNERRFVLVRRKARKALIYPGRTGWST